MNDQGHWTGVPVNPDTHFGFVYCITDNTTGHAYIGRKQIWRAKQGVQGCKSRVMDRGSDKWKTECWAEADWKYYSGSSKRWTQHLKDNPDNEYTFEVLHAVDAKGLLTYFEAREQWDRRVLETKLPNGERKYFNGQIGAIKFIPKFKEAA